MTQSSADSVKIKLLKDQALKSCLSHFVLAMHNLMDPKYFYLLKERKSKINHALLLTARYLV